MAKIIVSCRFQKSAKDIADLIRYMATREGVEKLPDTKKYNLSSSKQDDLILSVVKHFPQSKKFLEYEDFYARTLLRRVSPCVRFIEKRRVCTRANCSRGVGRLSRFVSDGPF